MMKLYASRTIHIVLPDDRKITIDCPQLTEEEFDNFMEILKLQKQGIINNPTWFETEE